MTLEANKAVAMEFFKAVDEGRLDALARIVDDELDCWVIGDTKASGTKNKGKFLREFERELALLDSGFNFRYGDITAEQDRVLVEVWSDVKLKSGGIYANTYVFKLQVRNGKIVAIREFLDTALVDRIFGPRKPRQVA